MNAARAAREQGYRKLDAYSPFPIEELSEALHLHKNKLPLIVLIGGILGGLTGYLLQYYVTVIYFPINIGGRPLHSWPSYIVITFELTILFAAISAVLGLLALCGLPMPYHPTFNVPRFALASRNRFFLCIEAADPLFDRKAHRASFWRAWSRGRCPKLRIKIFRSACIACSAAGSSAAAALLAGCRQDMQDQPKYIPLRPSDFFADGRSERPLIEGTVARGHLNDDTAFYTGKGPTASPWTRSPSRSPRR